LTDGLEATEEKLQQYREVFQLPSDSAGVVVASGDGITAMDLFDSPKTFGAISSGLLVRWCDGFPGLAPWAIDYRPFGACPMTTNQTQAGSRSGVFPAKRRLWVPIRHFPCGLCWFPLP